MQVCYEKTSYIGGQQINNENNDRKNRMASVILTVKSGQKTLQSNFFLELNDK